MTHVTTWLIQKHYAICKKPGTKEHIMYNSNCMKFQKKANIKSQKISEIGGCLDL